MSARLGNISLGGARIDYLFPQFGFDPEQIRILHLERWGSMSVAFRWSTPSSIGIVYDTSASTRGRVQKMFADLRLDGTLG